MPSGSKLLYQFGPFRLDAADRLLYRDDRVVPLPPKVLDTLLLLVAGGGRVLPKDEMMKQLWPDTFVEEGTLTQYISLLRKALGDGGKWIENLPRRGYRFAGPVEEVRYDPTELRIEEHTRSRTVIEEEVIADRAPASRLPMLATGLALLVVVTGAFALFWQRGRATDAVSFSSVAVLPIRTVSGEDHLADGIAEALATRLTNLKGLRVVSYSRVRRFAGSSKDAVEIGRQLGVEAVVEGTLRVASGRRRLSVHAIDTRTGYTIWADDRFEASVASLPDAEGRLAEAVALRLRGKLTTDERDLVAKSASRNPEAYDLVLRARRLYTDHWTSATAPEPALQMLRRAVQLDPQFADAHAWLALVQHGQYHGDGAAPDSLRGAISSANQALSLNPNSLIAMRALVHIQHSAGREVEGLLMARRALDSDPDDLNATAAAAEAYFRAGLHDRAAPLFHKALAAEPDNPVFRRQLARIYLFQGEYRKGIEVLSLLPPSEAGPFGMALFAEAGRKEQAAEVVRSYLGRHPNDFFGAYFGGCVLSGIGDPAGARAVWTEGARQAEGLLEKAKNPYARVNLGMMYAKLGRRDLALYQIDRSLAADPRHPVFLYFAAKVHALLGNRRETLDNLKAAIENGFFNLPMLDYHQRPMMAFHALRDDPELRALRADLARRVDKLRERY